MTEDIRISEIFGPTIQGEGPLIGQPTVFVRTAGCDYRCSWCDTLYAVLPEYRGEWQFMAPAEILQRVDELAGHRPILISLSGGNPALQPLGAFIQLARQRGHSFAIETQGSISQPWFSELDWIVVSPKPPSSHMTVDWAAVKDCLAAGQRAQCALKIVIFDDADYAFARNAAERFSDIPVYLQVGNPINPPSGSSDADLSGLAARFRWLSEKVANDRWFAVRVLPQLHVLIWGNKRGV